jgi:hypothetical protein
MSGNFRVRRRSRPANPDQARDDPEQASSGSSSPARADDSEVGYRKPPKHSRWKKGQSGNPKGRPPKSRNYKSLLKKELDERTAIREGGRIVQLTKREAIVKVWVDKSLKGDLKAIATVFATDDELAAMAETAAQANTSERISQKDRAIYEAILQLGAEAASAAKDNDDESILPPAGQRSSQEEPPEEDEL